MAKQRRRPANAYVAAALDWFRARHGREPKAETLLAWAQQYAEASSAMREEAYRRGAVVRATRAPTFKDFDDLG